MPLYISNTVIVQIRKAKQTFGKPCKHSEILGSQDISYPRHSTSAAVKLKSALSPVEWQIHNITSRMASPHQVCTIASTAVEWQIHTITSRMMSQK